MATDASTPLSAHYTLGDLTVTNQSLSSPNLPYTTDEMSNLTFLADWLENLRAAIPEYEFRIPSAYRTTELQEKLAALGEPVSPTKSFHEVGRGADIVPLNGDLVGFFGRIIANDMLRGKLSEISIKPSQGAIHLAVNVPGDERTPKVLRLDDSGTYVRMGDDEIEEYIKPYVPAEMIQDVASNISSAGLSPGIMMAIGAGVLALLFMSRGKTV